MALPNDVTYFNKTFYNSEHVDKNAVVEERFSRIFLHNPSQYHVSVERFELNISGIPFFTGGNNHVNGILLPNAYNPQLPPCYSLPQLIHELQSAVPVAALANPFRTLRFQIDEFGFIIIDFAGGAAINLVLSPEIQQIFGMQSPLVGATTYKSPTPRIDCGSQLNHVFLRTTLPVQSDAIGQVFENILTDVSASVTVGASISRNVRLMPGAAPLPGVVPGAVNGSTLSWQPSQKLIYQPSERRFTNISSNAPIQNIRIEAWYTTMDGTARPVPLGIGMGFSVKIGFYKRK